MLVLLSMGRFRVSIMRESTSKIRHHLLQLCSKGVPNVASEVARNLGLSKQAAARHLQALEKEGIVKSSGRGKAKVSTLIPLLTSRWEFKKEGLKEDNVWRENLAPCFKDFAKNVQDIWDYGITEMLNNAIDHSEGSTVTIFLEATAFDSTVSIIDDGEGIFHRIQRLLGLYDPREAILELAKGKLTTDPQHHSGQGIFFTSRMFDKFSILSRNLSFIHERGTEDWLNDNIDEEPGTTVILTLENDCIRTTKSVFDEFAPPDEGDYSFSKTIVPVKLAKYEGEKLVSRSQAKRLVARFEKFETVVLDFEGVEDIGQAFADEIFRVFAKAHPSVKLMFINVSPAVQAMISRALAVRL